MTDWRETPDGSHQAIPRRSIVSLALSAALTLAWCPGVWADDLKTVILNKWRDREHDQQQIRITWLEQQQVFKRDTDGSGRATAPGGGDADPPIIRTHISLCLDGPRIRCEEKVENVGDLKPNQITSKLYAYDGKTARGLVHLSGQPYPQGGVSNARALNIPRYQTVLLITRPMAGMLDSLQPEAMTIVGTEANLVRAEIGARGPNSGLKHSLLLDPTRDYVPCLWELTKTTAGTPAGQAVQTLYRVSLTWPSSKPATGWVPESWQRETLSIDGSPTEITRVSEIQMVPTTSGCDYTVEFPTGTLYFDHTKHADVYVVRDSGESRKVPPSELVEDVSRERLMEGSDAPPSDRFRLWTVARLSLILFLGLVGVIWVIRVVFREQKKAT